MKAIKMSGASYYFDKYIIDPVPYDNWSKVLIAIRDSDSVREALTKIRDKNLGRVFEIETDDWDEIMDGIEE